MIDFQEMCWDVDVRLALNDLLLNRNKIRNPDYFYATVDLVEDQIDPATRQPITMSGLNAWVTRCTTDPNDGDPDYEDHPSHPDVARRVFQDAPEVRNNRYIRPVHGHRS